jgi:hypothetical protein
MNELGSMWKEEFAAYFKALSHISPEQTEQHLLNILLGHQNSFYVVSLLEIQDMSFKPQYLISN